MNNCERRDAGLLYVADEQVMEQQKRARKLIQELNAADWSDFERVRAIACELLGADDVWVNPPFFCDYGFNIQVGRNFYANYNCTILDVATVKIGDNCLLGPNVSIYTAGHPLHPATRNTGYEYGLPVTIGDNVWVGGSVVVCPGVTIGDNAVIGAGSVVTRDVPSWTVAAGNPCRVLRRITEADRAIAFKDTPVDPEAFSAIERKAHPSLR